MQLALDGRLLTQPLHGIARYTYNLIRHLPLQPEDRLLVLYHPQQWRPEPLPQVQWVPWTGRPFSPLAQLELFHLLKSERIDLFHSPSFLCPWQLPCKWVLTLHDLIHVQRPQDYGPGQARYFAWLRQHVRQAAGILTVSESSAAAIRQWQSAIKAPLQVTYPGVEPGFKPHKPDPALLARYQLQPHKPYALFVGNPKPHKQFDFLQTFWQQQSPTQKQAQGPLVAIGLPASRSSENVFCLENVPDSHLPSLYSGAQILISPSLAEGFGLPPLEALACGTPVVVSDLPVYHEVLGSKADYFVPQDPTRLAQALQASHLRARPTRPPDLQKFNWQQMAQTTYAFYQHCHVA